MLLVNCLSWQLSFEAIQENWRGYASCQLSELTTVAFSVTFKKRNIISSPSGSKFPLLLVVLWVKQSLYKTPVVKTFRTSVAKLRCPLLRSLFWQGNLSTHLCKIAETAKLYYNCHVTSPVIIRFLLKVSSCHFSLYFVIGFTS